MADLAQPDLTALRWVQNELEQTLAVASAQLDELIAHKNDGQTHAQALKAIEQVRGALTLIGLEGLSHFVRACETLFAQLAIPASCGQCDEQLALVQRALDATADYLAEILNGALNQPLRLFDLFAEVRAATEGAAPALPSDLFFPRSIDSRPVADGDGDGEPAPSATPSQDQERTLRVLYQRGLLAVLRDGSSEAGIQAMLDAARSIKRLRSHGNEISALWQVAQALLEAIANGDLPLNDTIKRLCAALERQLRRGSSLSDETAQQLLREMLYQVIPVPPRSQLQQSVHSKWQLASHLPTPQTRPSVTIRTAQTLRKELKALKTAWEEYHRQKPNASFDQLLRAFAEQASALQRPWLDTFLQRLSAFTAWQSDSPAALPRPIAVEFAAALLLLDNAIARNEPAEYVPAQLNRTFERIEQLCHARPLTPLSALDRQATEQSALNAAAQIVITILDETEQALEACFRNPQQRSALAALAARLQQSQDALFFVGDDQAAALLQHISLHIEQLARASRPLSEKEAQTLAHRISALNLYLQNIRQGQYTHLSHFLRLQKSTGPRPAPERSASEHRHTASLPPTAADEEAQLRETFFAEADTILAEIAPCNQLDVLDTAALASLRRAYHTLKGSGRLVGLSRLSDTAWAIEEAFNRYLATPDQPPAELLALAAQAHAFFSAWLKALQENTAEADPAALIQQAKQLLQTRAAPPTASAQAQTDSDTAADHPDPHLQAVFIEESSELLGEMYEALSAWQNAPEDEQAPKLIARLLHTLKGNAHMTGLARLGSHFHHAETLLSQELATPAQYAELIASLHEVIDHARERISQLEQTPPADTAHAAPRTDTAQSVRVRTLTLQQLAQQNGDIRLTHARIENQLGAMREHLRDLSESLTRLREQTRETELQADLQLRSREPDSSSVGEQFFDPLEQDRYTRLQELSRHIVESADDIAAIEQGLLQTLNQTQTTLRQQDNASRLMERTLADTRSTAFSDIVERLQRVVRQSANTLGKQVQLHISGSENHIERNLLEQLTAPLEHLLRNALAHGIESSAEREALGKPPCGHIHLAISRSNEALQIELGDDGRGLDLPLLARKGRELGLLTADSTPDEDVLARLIFHPGFSTAEDLSTVSGRGIGMDIVQSAIDAANGRLEVHSQTGQGTRFQIQLPLTSLFTPVMLVGEGEHLLAIAANFIAHIPETASVHDEQVEYGGSIHPITPLAELLGQPQPPRGRKLRVLLLRAGAKTLALGVEKIIGGQEIILKNAGPQLARIPGIQGATLTAGGQIALMINPFALNSLHGGSTPAAQINQPQRGAILIVDDSLTVRKALALTVARSKRPVLTARNGAEALERLQGSGNPPVDLVISDLEMPLMDGFELLEKLSQSPTTAHIPVFIITSRLAEKHRHRATALGARQYLGKPYQDEELLALIENSLGASSAL